MFQHRSLVVFNIESLREDQKENAEVLACALKLKVGIYTPFMLIGSVNEIMGLFSFLFSWNMLI